MKNNTGKNNALKAGYTLLAIVLSFLLGFFWDAPLKKNQGAPADFFNKNSGDLIFRVKELIDDKYVDQVDEKILLYGALRGMVKSLDDPYSTFLDPTESKEFIEDLNGIFEGIGAEIGIRDNILTVISPLAGTPAEKAGLLPGYKIIKIDDTLTIDLTLDEAVRLIRGPRGTVVVLTVLKNGASKEISIIRDEIDVPSVTWKMLEADIFYLNIDNFHSDSSREFILAVNEAMLLYNPKGIILDLRSNPGGFLDSSVEIASWFVDREEVVVSERDGNGKEKQHLSKGPGRLKQLPLVVLVNEGSASASEIVAGALRDIRSVKLIGQKTFGKGSVQQMEPLPGNGQLKLTIAKWFTPKGHSIHDNGLLPDIKVEMTMEEIEQKKDPQLDRAIKELKLLL